MRQTDQMGRTGVSLMLIGGALVGYLVYEFGLAADLPSVMVGLSLICFGWSMVRRQQRQRRDRR